MGAVWGESGGLPRLPSVSCPGPGGGGQGAGESLQADPGPAASHRHRVARQLPAQGGPQAGHAGEGHSPGCQPSVGGSRGHAPSRRAMALKAAGPQFHRKNFLPPALPLPHSVGSSPRGGRDPHLVHISPTALPPAGTPDLGEQDPAVGWRGLAPREAGAPCAVALTSPHSPTSPRTGPGPPRAQAGDELPAWSPHCIQPPRAAHPGNG